MAITNKIVSIVVLALCIVMPISSATDYIVGDSAGWGLGTDYTTWAGSKNFVMGDNLVFNYDSSHSVAEVGSSDYTGCSTANALSNDNGGATTVKLKTAGAHYFVCGVSFHCSGGMKLAVNVKADSTATTASPATPSGSASDGSTTTPTATTTTPTTTSSHVPNSSPGTVPSFVAMLVGWFGFYVWLLVIMS